MSRRLSRRALVVLVLVSVALVAGLVGGVAYYAAQRRAREAFGQEEAVRRRAMFMVMLNEDAWQADPAGLVPVALADLPPSPDLPDQWQPVALAGRDVWLPAGVTTRESSSPETGRPRLIVSDWPGRDATVWVEWRPEAHDEADPSSLRSSLKRSEVTYEQLMAGRASELEALLPVYRLRGRDIERAGPEQWRDVFRLVYLKDTRIPPRRHVVTPAGHHLLVRHDLGHTFAEAEVFDRDGKLLGLLHVGQDRQGDGEGDGDGEAAALGPGLTDPRVLAVMFEGPGALAGSPAATRAATRPG